MDYSATVTMMRRAAENAGRGLIRDFGEVENLQVSQKGPRDFVSIADMNAEKSLIRDLQKARPYNTIISEESGVIVPEGVDPNEKPEFTFIIDPLDGTANFLHGIPYFCVSIGLEHNGKLVAGVVYDPIRDEMFYASVGKGAFVNDRRLRVSGRQNMSESVFVSGMLPMGRASADDLQDYLRQLGAVQSKSVNVRKMGSAGLDLCWVAAGRFDGHWQKGLSSWDCAGAIPIVKEAGGFVTNLKGADYNPHNDAYLVCANTDVHRDLLATVKGAL